MYNEPTTSDLGYITGTMLWYSEVCEREVWLMSRNLTPDQEDPLVRLGRVIHEVSYDGDIKEVEGEGIKVDILDKRGGLIKEVKLSSKHLKATRLQLAYYIWRLRKMGLEVKGGTIVIPRERKTFEVKLDDKMESYIMGKLEEVKKIVKMEAPPEAKWSRYCQKCAYSMYCWS